MKTTPTTLAALCAALVLLLAPASGALAANIDISPAAPTVISHDVCGNSDDAAQGDCAQSNANDGNTLTIGANAAISPYSAAGRDDEGAGPTSANGNLLNLYGVAGGAYGGAAASTADNQDATATGNKVVVSGAGSAIQFMGGLASATSNANASATGNQVSMASGTPGTVEGGEADCGGAGCAAQASGNTVTITGGAVSNGGIRGGYVSNAATADSATASGNTVTITGGTVSNLIISGGRVESATTACSTLNNTVEIGGSAVIGSGVSLNGGRAVGCPGSATTTGNTLKLGRGGVTVDAMDFFQKLDFTIPASLGNGATMLTVALATNISGVASADIGIAVAPGSLLKAGDEIVLIDASAGTFNGGYPAATAITSLTAGYAFETVAATNQLRVKVLSAPARSTTPAAIPTLSESALALLALLLGGVAALRARRYQ